MVNIEDERSGQILYTFRKKLKVLSDRFDARQEKKREVMIWGLEWCQEFGFLHISVANLMCLSTVKKFYTRVLQEARGENETKR